MPSFHNPHPLVNGSPCPFGSCIHHQLSSSNDHGRLRVSAAFDAGTSTLNLINLGPHGVLKPTPGIEARVWEPSDVVSSSSLNHQTSIKLGEGMSERARGSTAGVLKNPSDQAATSSLVSLSPVDSDPSSEYQTLVKLGEGMSGCAAGMLKNPSNQATTSSLVSIFPGNSDPSSDYQTLVKLGEGMLERASGSAAGVLKNPSNQAATSSLVSLSPENEASILENPSDQAATSNLGNIGGIFERTPLKEAKVLKNPSDLLITLSLINEASKIEARVLTSLSDQVSILGMLDNETKAKSHPSTDPVASSNSNDLRGVVFEHAPECPARVLNSPDHTRTVRLGVATALEYDGCVLLTQRHDGLRSFPGLFVLPGGHIDTGETLNDTAVRELFEETGLDAAVNCAVSKDLLGIWESCYPYDARMGPVTHHHAVVYMHAEWIAKNKPQLMVQTAEVQAVVWIDAKGIKAVLEQDCNVFVIVQHAGIVIGNEKSTWHDRAPVTDEYHKETAQWLWDRMPQGTRFALRRWLELRELLNYNEGDRLCKL